MEPLVYEIYSCPQCNYRSINLGEVQKHLRETASWLELLSKIKEGSILGVIHHKTKKLVELWEVDYPKLSKHEKSCDTRLILKGIDGRFNRTFQDVFILIEDKEEILKFKKAIKNEKIMELENKLSRLERELISLKKTDPNDISIVPDDIKNSYLLKDCGD